jgi:preprotein translocase subunit SecD
MRLYLVASILVIVAAMGGTLASGDEPVLGLDLQGGISVVLEPVGKFKPGALDVELEILRDRVDGLGVAEPEINRQGNNIVVDLPGVKDREKARRVVGQTAELRFRPVLAELPPAGATSPTTTSTSGTTVPGAPTSASTSTTTTTAPPAKEAIKAAVASCDLNQLSTLVEIPTTSRVDDKRNACVVLPVKSDKADPNRRLLGPTYRTKVSDGTEVVLTGDAVAKAKSEFAPGEGYAVSVTFTDTGAQAFDALAAESYPKSAPENRVAIVLDGVVVSDPAFQAPSFSGDVQITGDFTQSEAEELSTVINYGVLPIELRELTVENVSPTLGQDQLDAGIAAGVIGLALVALYMLVYYRVLGAVVVIGLLLTVGAMYSFISFVGPAIGIAPTLTLAGVTGLIVSIGVTVDSYVVYFERLKDEVRTGKTVRSSVDRGFARSFKTIIAADLVSLIGAAALYFIAIGSVKGFALFLAISTILDLLVAYFFMHPAVSLMARRPALVRMRKLGIASGLDTPEATA